MRISLGLCDAGPCLYVSVQWDSDGGQDTDDGHHDHELDESKTALVACFSLFHLPTCSSHCSPSCGAFEDAPCSP
jgi:hypothetical protein